MNIKQIFRTLIRLLIGIMFIITAILKLISIDNFEIYIYSFNLFSLFLSSIVARLLICVELIIGFFLIFKIFYRYTWWFTMLMMIGFTLFLIYVAIFRNDSNCHCFGDLVELDPIHSIIKNGITILFLLFIYRIKEKGLKWQKALAWVIPTLALFISFIIITPDKFYIFFTSKQYGFDDTYFYDIQKDTTLNTQLIPKIKDSSEVFVLKEKNHFQLDSGNYIIGFMASGCTYCQLSVKKIDAIFNYHHLPKDRSLFLMWGNDKSFINFWKSTEIYTYHYRLIDPYVAIDLTAGIFPLYILVKNNKVVKAFDYRGISENELVDFLR